MNTDNYDNEYQRTHDIDWFFKCSDVYYHVASNGGAVPEFISKSSNKELQRKIRNFTNDKLKIIYNEAYNHLNLESFKFFARLGFISIDRLNHNSFEDQNYIVMAKPCELGGNKKNLKDLNIQEIDISKFHIVVTDIDMKTLIP